MTLLLSLLLLAVQSFSKIDIKKRQKRTLLALHQNKTAKSIHAQSHSENIHITHTPKHTVNVHIVCMCACVYEYTKQSGNNNNNNAKRNVLCIQDFHSSLLLSCSMIFLLVVVFFVSFAEAVEKQTEKKHDESRCPFTEQFHD